MLPSVRNMSLKLCFVITLCMGFAAWTACGRASPIAAPISSAFKILHHVSYIHPADSIRNGQLYLPESSGTHPAILLIHGGTWKYGSNHNSGVSFLAPRLAARGWVVFNINYRLMRQGGAFPKDVQDVKDALAWMILHAKKYHIASHDIALGPVQKQFRVFW